MLGISGNCLVVAGLLLSAAGAATAAGDPLINEGFEGAGLPAGWTAANFSADPASEGWYKPVNLSDTFSAYAGSAGSYATSSVFVGVTDPDGNPAGKIDALLLTPVFAMDEATSLRFFTRTVANNSYGESLKVGTLIGGSFHEVMTINPSMTVGAYPEAWTAYTVELPSQGEGATGQYYFEYLVPNAATAGNVVGLDSVTVTTAVPEPATWLMLLAGSIGLLARRRCTGAA